MRLLGATEPDIEKLSEAQLLEMVYRINAEIQSKRQEINQLSTQRTSGAVLQLRVILYQNINHNLAILQNILEKRVYATHPSESPALRIFAENVIVLLHELRAKIISACQRRHADRKSLPITYKYEQLPTK
jgi:hypothetical protein